MKLLGYSLLFHPKFKQWFIINHYKKWAQWFIILSQPISLRVLFAFCYFRSDSSQPCAEWILTCVFWLVLFKKSRTPRIFTNNPKPLKNPTSFRYQSFSGSNHPQIIQHKISTFTHRLNKLITNRWSSWLPSALSKERHVECGRLDWNVFPLLPFQRSASHATRLSPAAKEEQRHKRCPSPMRRLVSPLSTQNLTLSHLPARGYFLPSAPAHPT